MAVVYRQPLTGDNYDNSQEAVNAVHRIDCQLRIVSLLSKDYIFLVSQEELGLEQAVSELLSFLADDFLLDQDAVEIVSVHADAMECPVYRRFNMVWTERGLKVVPQKAHRPISQIKFLETLLNTSKVVEDEEYSR